MEKDFNKVELMGNNNIVIQNQASHKCNTIRKHKKQVICIHIIWVYRFLKLSFTCKDFLMYFENFGR